MKRFKAKLLKDVETKMKSISRGSEVVLICNNSLTDCMIHIKDNFYIGCKVDKHVVILEELKKEHENDLDSK